MGINSGDTLLNPVHRLSPVSKSVFCFIKYVKHLRISCPTALNLDSLDIQRTFVDEDNLCVLAAFHNVIFRLPLGKPSRRF